MTLHVPPPPQRGAPATTTIHGATWVVGEEGLRDVVPIACSPACVPPADQQRHVRELMVAHVRQLELYDTIRQVPEKMPLAVIRTQWQCSRCRDHLPPRRDLSHLHALVEERRRISQLPCRLAEMDTTHVLRTDKSRHGYVDGPTRHYEGSMGDAHCALLRKLLGSC
jgi:hypothetical protein